MEVPRCTIQEDQTATNAPVQEGGLGDCNGADGVVTGGGENGGNGG